MRRSLIIASVLVVAAAALGACTNTPENKPVVTPPVSPSPAASPSASPVLDDKKVGKAESLVGQWPGVEGSYLNITKKGEKYSIEIANLDGPKTYEGTAKGDTIEFTRSGKTETIKTATGVETGMKGFEKLTGCVVVIKGSEGFCKK